MSQPAFPELLAPAGNMEKLAMAIHYGADAVYLGGPGYGLRARAGTFEGEMLAQAIRYAHARGVQVYVTVNIFAHNRDLDALPDYLRSLDRYGADGIIVADPGVLHIARATVPRLALHLSTQANVTNYASARFWEEQGIRRLNLARELSLQEIRTIRAATDLEIEVFVHGALCISYSGRCMLSSYLTGRDANRGDCAHPCRYSYHLVEEKRPGQFFPVEEDDRGTYIFNSSDLCLLGELPRLISAGVDAIKIEGRMKSVGYVGAVVRLYRAALDWIQAACDGGENARDLILPPLFRQEAGKIGTRGLSENFFQGPPGPDDMDYRQTRHPQRYAPAGIVMQASPLLIETRHVIEVGDELEHLGRDIAPARVRIMALRTEQGEAIRRANPGNRVFPALEPPLDHPDKLDLLRRKL